MESVKTYALLAACCVMGLTGCGDGGAMVPSDSEAAVIKALRDYASAQRTYLRAASSKNGLSYSASMPDLYNAKDAEGKPLGLIPKEVADAHGENGKPFHGYIFMECKLIGYDKVNWETDYALCATPANYGGATRLTFAVCTTGTVHERDLGAAKLLESVPSRWASSSLDKRKRQPYDPKKQRPQVRPVVRKRPK